MLALSRTAGTGGGVCHCQARHNEVEMHDEEAVSLTIYGETVLSSKHKKKTRWKSSTQAERHIFTCKSCSFCVDDFILEWYPQLICDEGVRRDRQCSTHSDGNGVFLRNEEKENNYGYSNQVNGMVVALQSVFLGPGFPHTEDLTQRRDGPANDTCRFASGRVLKFNKLMRI